MHKVQWEGRGGGGGGVKGLKRVAREGVWWVQPVSSSPPSVPDTRQNGLVDFLSSETCQFNTKSRSSRTKKGRESEKVVRESYHTRVRSRRERKRIFSRVNNTCEQHFLKIIHSDRTFDIKNSNLAIDFIRNNWNFRVKKKEEETSSTVKPFDIKKLSGWLKKSDGRKRMKWNGKVNDPV